MPDLANERIEVADKTLQRLANTNEMTHLQAILYSRSVCHNWDSKVEWDDKRSPEQLNDAIRLIQVASVYEDAQLANKASQAYRRAGKLLEWLSRAQDSLYKEIPLALLSGASFQLGGYPAMASALLATPESVLGNRESLIYVVFFRAEFLTAVKLCINFWAENADELQEKSNESGQEFIVPKRISIELIRCLGLLSWAFHSGETERASNALEKLKLISRFAGTCFSGYTWLLLSLLERTATKYLEASIWQWTKEMLPTVNEQGQAWLKRYARRACLDGKPLAWPSQQEGIERLISFDWGLNLDPL